MEKQKAGLRTGVDAWGIAPSFHIGYGGNAPGGNAIETGLFL